MNIKANNMNRISKEMFLLLSLSLIAFITQSCNRENEMIDSSFKSIYKVSEISLEGGTILPKNIDDNSTESRAFYESIDTALVFKDIPSSKPEHKDVCAIDWRITDMDVITLTDYDASHPSGSSLKDILMLEYKYKKKHISIKVSDIKYGIVMLSDYYPYDPDFCFLYLSPINERQSLYGAKVEVIIKDSFGRTLNAKSE